MKVTSLTKGLFIGLILFTGLGSISVKAQETNWWLTNSLKLDSLSSDLLFHAEGAYSFYTSSGNVDMILHDATPKLFLRKGRFLVSAFGEFKYQKMKVLAGQTSRTWMHNYNVKLIYDLFPDIQSETGILLQKDDSKYLDNRTVYYSGFSYNTMENEKVGQQYFLAGGYQTIKPSPLPLNIVAGEIDQPVVYVAQTFVLKTIPDIEITETATFIQDLDTNKSYQATVNVSAQFAFTDKVAGLISYQLTYDKEPIVPQLAPFVDNMNTAITFGVNLSL
jgi:hypothetical protein